jgi:ABC-2 type transport system ATP-binding protein
MFEFDSPAPATATPAIQVSHLKKRYGNFTAVDDVSFDVQPGDFFAFLGPNGAGKTTTIHAITGLVEFQQGVIKVFGQDVRQDFRSARGYVGLANQEFNFDRYLTIEEVLTFHAGYYGIPMSVAKPRARQLLTNFELWSKRDVDFMKLSGGMKRRLSIARALITSPRVLILDEPTAGVDLELRLELWDFLRALNRQGMTIFLTTHYLEEAEKLCNRIAIINQGNIVALEEKDALMARLAKETLVITLESPVVELPGALADYQVAKELDGRRLVIQDAPVKDLARILRALEARGYALADVKLERQTLQDIFLSLTGKSA